MGAGYAVIQIILLFLQSTFVIPSVISPSFGCQLEFEFIQQSLPSPVFASSEIDGLNLNITVPSSIPSGAKLPVFVFIRGGGFIIGGNSWPQYNTAKLVEMAVEQNKPIIAININYRVGVFGFLTSEELRNAGYTRNNGLRD
ncbi:alpha/beta-hydrolase [Mollisia scopiformis]|uniref:Alpha/beta-hydrolase n=1 Tax=Mollisia scopiformis TaxID=149040 RepID=A0A194X066_MOLSC|nr:alpha/beta-hydrolase [Mollisia scopiformis]KUJ13349.1 alpha/beta-hydrolase [Mollisia scopiformis]